MVGDPNALSRSRSRNSFAMIRALRAPRRSPLQVAIASSTADSYGSMAGGKKCRVMTVLNLFVFRVRAERVSNIAVPEQLWLSTESTGMGLLASAGVSNLRKGPGSLAILTRQGHESIRGHLVEHRLRQT